MSKEMYIGIPEPLLEAQDYLKGRTVTWRGGGGEECEDRRGGNRHKTNLVEQAKAKVIDGLLLPLRERRLKQDGLCLQHSKGNSDNDSVCLEEA